MNHIKVFTGVDDRHDGAVELAKTRLQEWIDETASATNLLVRGITLRTNPVIFQAIVLYDDPNAEAEAEAVDGEEPLLADDLLIDDDLDLEAALVEVDKC